MTIKVGDTVRHLRRRQRTPESSTNPSHCQIWETIELSPEKQRLGLVTRNAINFAAQLTVLCEGKERYWFLKNVEKVEEDY